MTKEDLKLNNIISLSDFDSFLNESRPQGIFYIPTTITKIIYKLAMLIKPKNAIVLNSNYGEISSSLDKIVNTLSIDINTNNIEISEYLNPDLKFINVDPLQFYSSELFELVLTFPPFGNKIKINQRIALSEIFYIERSLNLLSENGTAILILPSTFLSSSIYSETRKLILSSYGLSKIVIFPHGVIKNLSIPLSILEIKNSKVTHTAYYYANTNYYINLSQPIFSVPVTKLRERWDFNYHDPRNQKYTDKLYQNETKKISDLVEIHSGIAFKKEDKQTKGSLKIITPRNIINGILEETPNDRYIDITNLNSEEDKAILQIGDILLPRIISDKVTVYNHDINNEKLIASLDVYILRGKNAAYVASYLNTVSGLSIFNQQIKRHSKGSAYPFISFQDLANIEIPILSIADLEYASKSKLEKLSYDQLLEIKEKYDLLKTKYSSLKKEKVVSPHEEQLQSMQNTLQQVFANQQEQTQKLTIIESKIDDIKTVILNLSVDFKEIQNLPREIDEKISRLNKKLEEQISKLHFEQKQIDTYIKEIKNWFDYYDLLESKSQKYLPEAEYIFDHISKLENPDYSPFILQYCRALENELLSKIFRAYVQSLIDRKIPLEIQYAWDFEKNPTTNRPFDRNKNTFELANEIKKYLTKSNSEWFFEFGKMRKYLGLLNGDTVRKSPILKDLKKFVLTRFEVELLNIVYLDEIIEYRNKSAHPPGIIDSENALKFHKQMKECLISLLENYKNKE
jgi:hypothetical protein